MLRREHGRYPSRARYISSVPISWRSRLRSITALAPGTEVRLRYSYLIKCEEVVKDNAGNVVELRCTYDPQSGNGSSSDGRRVKGVIHWVSVPHARAAEVRLYSNLFTKEDPNDVEEGKTFLDYLNPDSVVVRTGYIEPSLAQAAVSDSSSLSVSAISVWTLIPVRSGWYSTVQSD